MREIGCIGDAVDSLREKKNKTLIGAMLFHLNSFETNVNIIRIQILIFFSILLMLK